MLVTAIVDCGARGACAAVERNEAPAQPEFLRETWDALKARPNTQRDGVCDEIAAVNCLANMIGNVVSTNFRSEMSPSQKINGIGAGSNFCTMMANGVSGGMKIKNSYPPRVVRTMISGTAGGTLLSFAMLGHTGESMVHSLLLV
jgi:hypothetical protein